MTPQQYLCMRSMLGRALAANSYLYANPSDGEVLGFFNQLVNEASGAAALTTAQQDAIGYAFRGILSGNFPGTPNPSAADVLAFWTQLSTDASGAAALAVPRYDALKQALLAELALNYPGTTNPSTRQLLGYIAAVAGFSGNFASLFTGSIFFVVQGDRGIAQSGGIITGVTDQSASIPFSSTNAGQRPAVGTGFNGHSSILTDGSNDELHASIALPGPAATAFYLYAIFKPTTNGGQSNYLGGSSGGGVIYSATGNVNNLTQGASGVGNVGSMTSALTRVYAEYTGSISDRLKIGAGAFITGTSSGVGGDSIVSIGGIPAGVFSPNMEFVLGCMATGVLAAPAMADIDAKANAYWGGVLV
jgi:hypothetical protein